MDNILNLPKDKKLILATHSGSYHIDDIFASAVLSMLLLKLGYDFEIIRTRNEELIENSDIAYDVGGIYDLEKLRFDHHQVPGPMPRTEYPNIPYSSLGLIWKHFGLYLCDDNIDVWNYIENNLVRQIDAGDNGIPLDTLVYPEIETLRLGMALNIFKQTWRESEVGDNSYKMFSDLVSYTKFFISRLLIVAKDNYEGVVLVKKAYDESIDKRIIVLEKYLPWNNEYVKYPEPIFVVHPSSSNSDEIRWSCNAVRKNLGSFESRLTFPSNWAGQRDEDLESVTGVKGLIFCHKAGFLCVAKTKEAAIEIAKKTLGIV